MDEKVKKIARGLDEASNALACAIDDLDRGNLDGVLVGLDEALTDLGQVEELVKQEQDRLEELQDWVSTNAPAGVCEALLAAIEVTAAIAETDLEAGPCTTCGGDAARGEHERVGGQDCPEAEFIALVREARA
jgi:hypothetical protein